MNLIPETGESVKRNSKIFRETDDEGRLSHLGVLNSPTEMYATSRSGFCVTLTGRLESAYFPFVREYLYCRYSYTYGSDWDISHGVNSGITQIAQSTGADKYVVWNFPIEISFQSWNIYGWPRLVVSVYGLDYFGRDIVRGYGSILCPTTAGLHEISITAFTPMESSMWRRLTNWLTGTHPEFYHSNFVAQGNGRALTLVRANGVVNVVLNVMMTDCEACDS